MNLPTYNIIEYKLLKIPKIKQKIKKKKKKNKQLQT